MGGRKEVATALGLPVEKVTLHVTLLGGGFGRKSKPDFIVEAALLSKKVGRPVKVTWTREDEIQHGFYHSVSAQHLEAGLDAEGRTVAWRHRTVFPTIASTFDAKAEYPPNWELGLGFSDLPFDVPNLRLENAPIAPHVRIGWLRSVANIYHAFADRLVRGRAGPRRGRRSQGLPPEADRRASARRPEGRGVRQPELRRLGRGLSPGHRAAPPRDRARREGSGLGHEAAQGPRPRDRRPPQLPDLRRGGGRGLGGRRREPPRSRRCTSPSTAGPSSTATPS